MRKLLLLIILIAWTQSFAKNIYIAQTSKGAGNGMDAADAYAITWVNNVSNWGSGPGQVNGGDTIHLTGTFTSSFVVPGSGSAGNYITILFDPGANFTTGCWPSSGAIELDGNSYLVIDGGTNGLITNTSNGTGLATQNNSRGIGGSNNGTAVVSSSTIQNLTVSRMYYKVKGVYDDTRAGYDIDVTGSNVTVQNCNLSDGDGLLNYSASGTMSNINLLNNNLHDGNHLMVIGAADHNGLLSNINVIGNHLDHTDTWDDPGNTPIHLDAIIILNNAYDPSSVINNFTISKNTFGPNVGTRTTAAIFTDYGGLVTNYFIYNNLFQCASGYSWGNGFIVATGSNCIVANNTLMGTIDEGGNWGGGINVSGTNAYCYNNLLASGAGISLGNSTSNTVSPANTGSNDLSVTGSYLGGIWSDYNIIVGGSNAPYQLVVTDSTNGNSQWLSGEFEGLSAWQTWYGNEYGWATPNYNQLHCDPHSNASGLPTFIPGTFVPASNDIVARGQGTNLSTYFTTDFYGNTRASSGAWTIGAFDALPPSVVISGNGGGIVIKNSGGGMIIKNN